MLQHQIVQSPARLGLTNPNSPSLSNPTPPKFSSSQPPQHHPPLPQPPQTAALNPSTSTSSPTVSSALLSLLPPLPRAQSLLLQMASLASKLFEVSPNRSLWLSAFRGSFPTFLSSQTLSIPFPPLDSPVSSTKEIIAVFNSLQKQLFEAVSDLQEILDLQDANQRLAREIKSKDSTLIGFANKLKEAERVLDVLVDDYSDYRRPKRVKFSEDPADAEVSNTTVASQLKLSDILSYAHRISYTTFAPPEFGAGSAPLRGALPPAPQDEQLRASQLYNFADLDVGLPKTDESKERTIEAIVEPLPPPPPAAAEAGSLPNFDYLLRSNIKVPENWKPGMPIELPKDLSVPPPPPGWKPGDPLPPLESLPVPRITHQAMQGIASHGLHKPALPMPIQVAHVELDIPEEDDDSSSSYTSSVGGTSDGED